METIIYCNRDFEVQDPEVLSQLGGFNQVRRA